MGAIIDIKDINLIRKFEKMYPGFIVRLDHGVFRSGVIRIFLEKGGETKSMYYNLDEEKPASNFIDGAYTVQLTLGNMFTLHSYKKDDKLRVLICITNVDNGVVLPYGYDINKKEIIELPLDNDGLLEDEVIFENINKEEVAGIEPRIYKKVLNSMLNNIFYVLPELGVDSEICYDLAFANDGQIKELMLKTMDRICGKHYDRKK